MSITNKEHSDLTSVHKVGLMQPTDPGAIGYGKMWIDTSEDPARIRLRNDSNTDWIDTSISFFELQNRIEELETQIDTNIAPTTAPANPTGLAGTLAGNSVRWKWTRVNDQFVSGYNIYRGTTFIAFVDADEYVEPVAESLALTVKSVRAGNPSLLSTGTTAFFSLTAPSAPSGYDIIIGKTDIIHNWTVVPGYTYDIASSNDGSNIIGTNLSSGNYRELNFSTASRTITRYIRAVRYGVTGAWSTSVKTITLPVAPVLTEDTTVSNNFQVGIKIATTTPIAQINTTIIQTRKQGDSFPADTNPSTNGVTVLNGNVTQTTLVGVAGETWEVRVKQTDIFGEGDWSNTITHTFPSVGIDTTSAAYQVAGTNDPIRTGGGTFTFTAGGLLQWSAAMVISGLSSVISTAGTITIPLNTTGTAIADGQMIVYRWNTPAHGSPDTGSLQVVSISGYAYPTIASNQIDYEIARREGSYVRLYDGRVFPIGSSMEANTSIARLSAGTAYIGTATIDGATITNGTIVWAKVSSLQTSSYVVDTTGFKITDDVFEINSGIRTLGLDLGQAAFRSLIGLDPSGVFRGRDTAKVPASRIVPFVDSSVVSDGDHVFTVLAADITGQGTDITSNGDTISLAKVEVYNKFGEFVKQMPTSSFLGNGTIGISGYARKYADPFEEAYFKISIKNYYGYSSFVYLKSGSYGTTIPTLLLRSATPLDASASPVDATSVSLSYQFTGNVDLQYRKVGIATWSTHTSGITASPFTASGLTENTQYEFKFLSAANSLNSSNIVRARTKQQGAAAPTRPAPSGITGSPTSGSGTSSLTFNWVRNATDNTDVEIYVDGTLVTTAGASVITYTISGLGEGVTRSVKVRNKWGTGDYSGFSDIAVATTSVTPPTVYPPTITGADWDATTTPKHVRVYFTAGSGGSGTFTLEHMYATESSWSVVASGISSGATYYDDPALQTSTSQTVYYRVKQANPSESYSNIYEVIIPAYDSTGAGGSGGSGGGAFGGCFTYDTPVYSADGYRQYLFNLQILFFGKILIPSFIQKSIGDVKVGEYVYAPDDNGKLIKQRVIEKYVHDVNGYYEVEFDNEIIETTREHPFRISDNSFKPIGKIESAVVVTDGSDRTFSTIETKNDIIEDIKVYNLEVENLHTYIVGKGKEVHNLKPFEPDMPS